MATESTNPIAAFDPKHVIALGLVAFGVLLWRVGAFKTITDALDARGKKIADELAEAKRLRTEAEALLAQYMAKTAAADAEAKAILDAAVSDAEALRRQAKQELEADLARRQTQAEERIRRAEAQAQADVTAAAADAAIAAAERLLGEAMTKDAHSRLVAAGVTDLAKRFG